MFSVYVGAPLVERSHHVLWHTRIWQRSFYEVFQRRGEHKKPTAFRTPAAALKEIPKPVKKNQSLSGAWPARDDAMSVRRHHGCALLLRRQR
jgi:hypothetical protein